MISVSESLITQCFWKVVMIDNVNHASCEQNCVNSSVSLLSTIVIGKCSSLVQYIMLPSTQCDIIICHVCYSDKTLQMWWLTLKEAGTGQSSQLAMKLKSNTMIIVY